jgi:hypothetical protein
MIYEQDLTLVLQAEGLSHVEDLNLIVTWNWAIPTVLYLPVQEQKPLKHMSYCLFAYLYPVISGVTSIYSSREAWKLNVT